MRGFHAVGGRALEDAPGEGGVSGCRGAPGGAAAVVVTGCAPRLVVVVVVVVGLV
jgi:hypothetical protein